MVPTIMKGTEMVTKCFTLYWSSMVWTRYKVIVHSNRSFRMTSCRHLLTVTGSILFYGLFVMVFTVNMSINVHESTTEKFEENLNFLSS
jgi:hypothetical protein